MPIYYSKNYKKFVWAHLQHYLKKIQSEEIQYDYLKKFFYIQKLYNLLSQNKSMIRLFPQNIRTYFFNHNMQHRNFIHSHFIYQGLLIEKIKSILPYVQRVVSNNNFDEEYVVG